MSKEERPQRGRFGAPSAGSERRRRKIVFVSFIMLILLYFLKATLPHQTIHYAVDSIQSYTNKNYTRNLQNYIIPLAPLVASILPGDPLAQGPTGASGYGTLQRPQETDSPSVGKSGISQPSLDGKSATSNTAVVSSFDISVSPKVAVIIESRVQKKIIPLILHFVAVLGPEWPIIVYTSTESLGMFSASAAFNRYRKLGRIQIRLLPITVLFTNSNSVNAFFTKSWIWHQLAPAEHVLIFQSDSMLCANAARSVDEFLKYDFVGAPIATNLGKGYNGGLSLRRRPLMEAITKEFDWEANPGIRFEDQWFFERLVELQERGDPIHLPTMEVARTFSVETIDFPHPLGVHQVHRWIGQGMVGLDDWCPEYKLCSEDHVVDT